MSRTIELTDTEIWLMQSVIRPMLGDPDRYGSLTIQIQAGKVVHVNEGVDRKPPGKAGKGRDKEAG